MDSGRLDWKLARVIGSYMVEIRDVTVTSEIFAATLFTLHCKVTKLWRVKIVLEEWVEDDSAVLSKDDNSCLLKPTSPFSYFRLKKWSNLKSNKEERKLEVRKCNSVPSSAELHGKERMSKALISSINTDG